MANMRCPCRTGTSIGVILKTSVQSVQRQNPFRFDLRRLARFALISTSVVFGIDPVLAPSSARAADLPAPVGLDRDAVRSPLTIVAAKQDGHGGIETPAYVMLGQMELADAVSNPTLVRQNVLLHEFVRQAVLMAARDILGAVTRDESLGEALPGKPPEATMDVRTYFMEGAPAEVSIRRIDPTGIKVLWTGRILERMSSANDMDYAAIVANVEALARGALSSALRDIGVVGTPAKRSDSGDIAEDIGERLEELTFTEQFMAIRATYDEIRQKGESTRRLGALIRGYANLGMLTEFHWNTAHKALKARAILLAQRWVARDPTSPEALFHRAYAWALTGAHKLALDDLAEAKRRASDASAHPAWAALIEAHCRFETETLIDANHGRRAQLAMLLAYINEEGSKLARAISIGQLALKRSPECYRIVDGMCDLGGVSIGHFTTTYGMQVFTEALPQRLKALVGLPPKVDALVKDSAHEAKIATALIDEGKAADSSALSWTVLGQMIRDARFVIVWRRANFLRYYLGLPMAHVANFLDETRPYIADHPYRPLIQTLAVDPAREKALYSKLLDSIKIPILDFNEVAYINAVGRIDYNRWPRLDSIAILHGDVIYRDVDNILGRIGNMQGPQYEAPKKLFSHICEDISPFSYSAKSALIITDWPYAETRLEKWGHQVDEQPHVQMTLGWRYHQLKRWDDAKKCFEKALRLSQDKYCYEMLASIYKEQGKMDQWKATLDRFLDEAEDHALDHAGVRVQIANHFMELKQWKEAQPYAEAAAETWASWAMQCAQRCYEGLEDWENAELWASRNAQRYPDTEWGDWFLFCNRTGKGDIEAARDFAVQYANSRLEIASGHDKLAFGCVFQLAGDRKKAIELFDTITEPDLQPERLINTALIADDIGDKTLRDDCLQRFQTDQRGQSLKTAKICQLFQQALRDGDKGKLDLAAVDDVIARMAQEGRPSAYFTVGRFLQNHGTTEEWRRYFQQVQKAPETYAWYGAIVADALRRADRGAPANENKVDPKNP
jgi:tetratricopeptide (TPR) repeat protein